MAWFRREALTRVPFWRMGTNALGVIEFGIVLAPIVTRPNVPTGTLGRVLLLLCGVIAAAVDLIWRWRNEPDPRWWVRAFSWEAGGQLFFLPGWLWGLLAAALGAFTLVTVGDTPSPYAR